MKRFLLILLFFFSSNLFSQDIEKARKLNIEATKLFKEKRYNEAIEKLKEAFMAYPKEEILFNIALIYEKIPDVKGAYNYYNKYITWSTSNSPKRKEAEMKLKKFEKQILLREALLILTVIPEDSKVELNGKEINVNELLFIPAGKYKINVSRKMYISSEKEFFAKAGDKLKFEIDLQAIPITGSMILTVFPQGARIVFDGKQIGFSPLKDEIKNISAGKHLLRIEKEGYAPYEEELIFAEGDIKNIDFTLIKLEEKEEKKIEKVVKKVTTEKVSNTKKIIGWSGVGVGAICLTSGILLNIKAIRKANDANNLSVEDIDYHENFTSLKKDAKSLATYSYILYGVSAVAVGGGIYLILTGKDKKAQKKLSLLPYVYKDNGGFLLRINY